MLVAFIIGTAVLLVILLLFSKKKKPDRALKREQADRTAQNMNEKAAAISHVNGLLEAVAWNENKTKLIIKIIDRIGFPELEKNLLLAGKYHAHFAVPEKENTKKTYLKDWVEVMADNGELSNPEYQLCCDMATKYECSTDIIKEIMDEIGITLISTMKPTDWLKEIETIIYDYCEQTYHSKPNFRIKPYTYFKKNLNFDGLDVVEIRMAIEKKFSLKTHDEHPFFHRSANDTDFTVEDLMDALGLLKTTRNEKNNRINSQNVAVPDLLTTNMVIWMAHCINLPFQSQAKNMEINMSITSLLKKYENAVKTGDDGKTVEILNEIQHNMREKFGDQINNPMVKAYMHDFKICALSKDLLDMYKMVIEGKRDEDVLSGKGSIRRILKYSIELGSPAKTLDALVDYFVNNVWFDNMKEQVEWHKLALECMMVTGNGEMGDKILGFLKDEGGIGDDEKEELLDHAREFRNQIDVSWM